MPYVMVDNFAGGLDTRKSPLTSPAGSLQRLNDCVISPGGEIVKRKAFVPVADLTGTFGLAATSTNLYAFTRNTAVTAPPSGVPNVGLIFQKLPNASPTLTQADFDTFDGDVYLSCIDPAGVAPLNNPHYWRALQTEGSGKGLHVRTYASKVYTVLGKNLSFCAVGDPTHWASGTGAGFINLSMQDSNGDALVALEIYYDKLAVFSTTAVQLWTVDPDPLQNVLDQILRGAGSVSPLASQQYGSGDVLYLNQSGIRSVKARDASNAAAVSDIGSPIDLLIQALYSADPNGFSAAQAILEPIAGRFWMIFHDQIYVLSFFPGPHITAWSRFIPGFNIDYAAACNNHIFLRSGNTLYVYGGADGFTFDSTQAEVRLPYLDMNKPGHQKTFRALDMTVSGNWTVKNSFDYTNPDNEEVIGVFQAPTWRQPRAEFTGVSSHFSLRFYSSGPGEAQISNAGVHFMMADDEA